MATRWHPRLTVSSASTIGWPLDRELELYRTLGVGRTALLGRKIDPIGTEETQRLLRAAGVVVDNLAIGPCLELARPGQWEEGRATLRRALGLARELGTDCVVITTGPAGGLTWEAAADALGDALAPVLIEAAALGAVVAVEHTNGLRFDLGFLHNLRDTVDVAARIGLRICMEVNNVWGERGLEGTIARGASVIRTVQLNDFVVGTTSTPDRAVPGDGDIPLARIVGWLEKAGYAGPYEIEVVGPRIEAEGYPGALERSLTYLDALLRDAAPVPAG